MQCRLFESIRGFKSYLQNLLSQILPFYVSQIEFRRSAMKSGVPTRNRGVTNAKLHIANVNRLSQN